MQSQQLFPETRWSLVELARHGDQQTRRAGLTMLLERYLPALRSYLFASRRLPPERLDDLLQGFVADKIVEQDLLACACEERGKFRSFLLITLDRYAISQHRAETAAKRHPAAGFAPLDVATNDLASSDNADPALQFNIVWARELIAEALRRTRAACERSGKPDVWLLLEARVVRPALEGAAPADYEALVAQLKLATPLEACRLLAAGKRIFAQHLKQVAMEHAGAESTADEELEDLRRIVSRGCPTPR